MDFEKVHSVFPRCESQAGLTTVRPGHAALAEDTEWEEYKNFLPLIQIFDVRTTSRNTTNSGGGWLVKTDDG